MCELQNSNSSKLFSQIISSLHVITLFLACPCHSDCVDGCKYCNNPICERAIFTLYSGSTYSRKSVLIQPNGEFLVDSNRSAFDFIQGDVTKNIDFTMGQNTVVSDSCAAELNGEIFVFGGSILHSEDNPGLKRQVSLNYLSEMT